MTVWTTIERGEYIMIALAVIFVACIVIWWVRGAVLRRQRREYGMLMQKVRDYITEGDLENAHEVCNATGGPGARILEAGIKRIGRQMTDVESAMANVKDIEKHEFMRGMRWLKAFAVISPLLGLGGTLVGITDRLRDMGELGPAVDISMVCGEIAPTIVTTVAGLIVGIFALIAMTFLDATVNKSDKELDQLSAEFTNLLNEPS